MRKIYAGLLAALALAAAPAEAQVSKSTLLTQISTNLPDNTSFQITPAGVRAVLNNIVLSYLDSSTPPTITAPVTITVPSNTNTHGLIINFNGTAAGQPGNICGKPVPTYNGICINGDNAAHGNAFFYDFVIVHLFGGSSLTGSVNGTLEWMIQTAASSSSNPERFYAAVSGISDTRSGDGGTNTGAGSQGAYFGGNFQVRWSAPNLFDTTATEFDNYGASTGTTRYNWGINIVSFNSVQGASSDAGIIIYSGGASTSDGITYGPGVGFHQGISFAEIANAGLPPIDSGGTVIGTHLETLAFFSAAKGIDFANFHFSGNAWSSTGFTVSGAGNVTIGVNGQGAAPQLQFAGQTSQNVNLTPQANAGNATLTLPNTTGTLVSNVNAPLSESATTGAVSCTGCLYMSAPTSINFNVANTDTSVTFNCNGTTSCIPQNVQFYNCTGINTTATWGLFTNTGGTGVAIIGAGTVGAVSSTAANTANNSAATNISTSIAITPASLPTPNTLFLRVGTAQGGTSVCSAEMQVKPAQ
jgi:hypothetical protein